MIIPWVSPMDHGWTDWENALRMVLEFLPPDSVEIVSLCVSDHATATDLAAQLKVNVTCWEPDAMSLESMIERLSTARLVISARYHGALVSAASGVPTFILGLEQKLESLSYQLNNITLCRKSADLVYWIHHHSLGKLAVERDTLDVALEELQ